MQERSYRRLDSVAGSFSVPYREEGRRAAITTTIDRYQRYGLYELVRNHLGSIGDFWIALEQTEDFAKAEALGLEFAEDFRLLKTSAGRSATSARRSI